MFQTALDSGSTDYDNEEKQSLFLIRKYEREV